MDNKGSSIVKDKLITPIGDWIEEARELEPDPTGDDPITDWVVKDGMKPAQVGRMGIVANEMGHFTDGYFPGVKLHMMAGAAHWVNNHISIAKRKIKLQNGKEYMGRTYVAPVRDDDGGEEDDQDDRDTQSARVQSSSPSPKWLDEKVIESTDPEAVERAEKYLFKQVTGNIWNRLLLIAEHDPQRMADTAEALKAAIDEMVDRLS